MNKEKMLLEWRTFLEVAKKRGITKEELEILGEGTLLIEKYYPEIKTES